jgi:hypothetical protein
LSFDARGEADLRRPITSSLAIVQLQPNRQQPQQQVQQGNPASSSAAAAATTAGAAAVAAAAPGGGVAVLDWSRKLAVFAPDDCQLICDTPGHFKVEITAKIQALLRIDTGPRMFRALFEKVQLSYSCLVIRHLQHLMVGGDSAMHKSHTGSYAAWCSHCYIDAGNMMQLCLMIA